LRAAPPLTRPLSARLTAVLLAIGYSSDQGSG
jgi:hypothetical protein